MLLRAALIITLAYMSTVIWLWTISVDQVENTALKANENEQQLTTLSQAQQSLQQGFLLSTYDNEEFHSRDLSLAISHIPGSGKTGNFIWQDRAGNAFAYAALGIDRNHHFANSYLIGFEPYKTDKVWQPLVTLALKKTYQFDHDQHGLAWKDVWQNSQQAYLYSHGDCEDHAILLADWLIAMGYDARVAIGKIPSGGHAWVILFYDEKEYLLEATSKRRPRSIGDFSLAKYAPEYQPRYMFNRTKFWVNTGSSLTASYSGPNWVDTATFTRSSSEPQN